MCNCTDHDLERLRHTTCHVLSAAVGMMFKDVKRGVGPWIEEGFYQDFDLGENTISTDDFKKIQKKMRWIINKDFKVVKETCDEATARAIFPNDEYKQELIDGIVERGEDVTFYNFVDETGRVFYHDLCAGPHLESTGQIKVFKLTRLAGAYWRGDETKAQMTRVYGTAFETEEQLKEYEDMLAEAAKRDHRKLGKELGLFAFSDLVGPGLPLFTPKGTFLRNKIASTIQEIQEKYGYTAVHIPHICKKELYETSGHWQKYKDDLFHVTGKHEHIQFVMKPMNCPHHTQIYASEMRSYRDLPLRFSETTMCYRDEQPGEILGLSRVRGFTQDDGHVFCRFDQIKQEMKNVVAIIRQFYTKLDMFNEGDFWVSLSVRDSKNIDKYLGHEENWEKAEQILQEVAEEENLPYKRVEGEAAFYGPKLDFMFLDAIGREWQLATPQLDFVMPERFDLTYTNEKGEKERPVMIHRAIAGSLERFLSVIIEHFAGAFPAWLAPVQAHILPVNTAHEDFAKQLQEQLATEGGRMEYHDSSESLGKRIRNCQKAKVPFAIVIGDKEVESSEITIRRYGEQKDEVVTVEEFQALLQR